MRSIKRNIKSLLRRFTGRKLFPNSVPESGDISKVLVISLYFKGDTLFHTSALESLKHLLPDSKIDFWVKSRTADIFEDDKRLNELLVFDNISTTGYRENPSLDPKGKLSFLKKLRQNKYDLIIDLTGKYSTALLTLFAKGKYSIGFNYDYFGFCYDYFVNIDTSIEPGHLIEKYVLALYNGLSLDPSIRESTNELVKFKPHIFIKEETVVYISKLLNNLFHGSAKPLVVIHLSSGWEAKELPLEELSKLAKDLINMDYNFIFTGTESDRLKLRKIESLLGYDKNYFEDRFPILKFKETAELIRRSDVFVGSDSAPLHLAGAVGTASIGLFGPTNPGFSNPVGKKHKFIYHKLICSAAEHEQYCTRNGGFTCPLYECMNSIRSEEILSLIRELLKNEKVSE